MSAVVAAVVTGGAALIGGVISASGAQSAASTQAAASNNATAAQQGMFNTVVGNESPYLQSGDAAISQLNYLLGTGTPGQSASSTQPGVAGSSPAGGFGSLNAPFTADTFKQMSPAYQFQLQQGGQGVLNQDASAQGAESGAALKDLISFNQGMANTSFNNAFNQYQTQQGNTFNRLQSIAGLGQAAGSNQASGASNFGQGIAQSISNTGSAQAGGIVGATNAITGGLTGAANAYSTSQAIPYLLANSGGGGGYTPMNIPAVPSLPSVTGP